MTEALDPATFVQSYLVDKYKAEIVAWNEAPSPNAFIDILRDLNASKAAFVEICVALAEEVLPVFEKEFPKDLRPRKAIEAAKAWLKDRTAANTRAAAVASDAASNAAVNSTAIKLVSVLETWSASVVVGAAAWAASRAASAAADTSYASDFTFCTADDATRAGLPGHRIMDIFREVGYKYYAFLKPR
jgi:hypothetical protein